MYRFAILAALCGCGDGREVASADAVVGPDAGDRGIVRVRVTGFVENSGLTVYFQERDSSLSLATRTSGAGEATGRLGPDGFVTLVAGVEPALQLWTYAGVQPGDELEFYEPPGVNVTTPSEGIGVIAANAGTPPYILRSSCGGAIQIVDPLPVTLQLALCGERMDFLLEFGQLYRYVGGIDLVASNRRLEFGPEWSINGVSTVTLSGVPGVHVTSEQALVGTGLPLERTNSGAPVVDGVATLVHGIALPQAATLVTQLDVIDDDLTDDQHVIDWRPASTQIDLAFDELVVARASETPRYDASTTSIVWTSEASGARADLLRATLFWLDAAHARQRSWTIVGPRGDGDVLHVPLLPASDLVPSAEIPQEMQTFVAGDALAWTRTHLHGRWLPFGGTWPVHGPAGRVVWRSL